MKIGKLPPNLLENKILNHLKPVRDDVLVRSALGQDSSIVDMRNCAAVLSTDPITGTVKNMGWFAVHIACNDIAANGGEAVGVLITLLLPPTVDEEMIGEIMSDAGRAASELNIEILGGHTEVTAAVNQPVISTTAIGKTNIDRLVIPANIRSGMDIILTKGAGIEGTAILAETKEEILCQHLDEESLLRAKDYLKLLSVFPESKIAVEAGAAAMHDVTEGGVLGALFEVAKTAQYGFKVHKESIPISKETSDICNAFGIDPLRLISSGSMLIYCQNGEELLSELAAKGIVAAIIGKTTTAQKYLLVERGQEISVSAPDSDELWAVL